MRDKWIKKRDLLHDICQRSLLRGEKRFGSNCKVKSVSTLLHGKAFVQKKGEGKLKFALPRFGGGDRNRTGVQTWFSKAFYMLISELIVGKEPEQNKPILLLAGWS
jgi:hypothetical protein